MPAAALYGYSLSLNLTILLLCEKLTFQIQNRGLGSQIEIFQTIVIITDRPKTIIKINNPENTIRYGFFA